MNALSLNEGSCAVESALKLRGMVRGINKKPATKNPRFQTNQNSAAFGVVTKGFLYLHDDRSVGDNSN